MYVARIPANRVTKTTRWAGRECWARTYYLFVWCMGSVAWTRILVTYVILGHRLACKIELVIVVIWLGATFERHLPSAKRVFPLNNYRLAPVGS
jgi:hypothetical protein